MHIARVRIENVKGFGEGDEGVDLDLTDGGRRADLAGWTVLAGPNGSGKTTVLQAIALGLVDRLAHLHPPHNLAPWTHEAANKAEVEALVRRDEVDDPLESNSQKPVRIIAEWIGEGAFVARWATAPGGDPPTSMESTTGWFLAGYGPTRRVVGRLDDANSFSEHQPRRAAMAGLLRQDAFLAESIQWLKDLDYRRLKDEEEASTRAQAREQLNWIIALLEDDLLPGNPKIIGIEPDGLRVQYGGRKLLLRSLSDGYRTTAAFILDLVMRMARVYRDRMRYEYDANGKPFIPHSGVVLVDEMELHLHPSWQQKIGFWLKQHFPRVQFIVTTHSPFICQAADQLVRLSPPGSGRRAAELVDDETFQQVVKGGADEAVVSDLFGLPYPHAEQVERARERLAALEARELDGTLTDEERKDLLQLQGSLPYTPGLSVERVLRKAASGR